LTSNALWDDWLLPFLIISAAFLGAFFVTMYWLLPLQANYTPELAQYASLLFLPHGVRVLAGWLFGWRSIVLIAPASLYAHWLNLGAGGFSVIGIAGAMSGVVCAALSFWALAKLGMDFRTSSKQAVNWRNVMLAGSFASFVNTVGMGLVYRNDPSVMAGYLVGDISGMFACLLMLMLVFKLLRHRQSSAGRDV
jgi:uncharacterized membrane-anchored protein YitT (DUF2179 family)